MSEDRRIHHIGIVVDNIEEACEFLSVKLGITVGDVEDLGPGKVAWAPCGDVQLELLEYKDPEYKRKHLGAADALIEHIAFHVDDADAEYLKLRDKGIEFRGLPNSWHDRKTFFTTPESCDGVMYQFREPIDPPVAEKTESVL
jgi:catechol 2,3-dioxygenase-like lactoylglutathione lyase family enzyme